MSTYIQPEPGAMAIAGVLSNLHEAVTNCSYDVIQEILRVCPESVHHRGWNNMIPLHRACLRGDLEITRLLLKSGSNPNARNNFDETALHFACKRGHPAMIHLLLEYGADILAGDKKGRALMHHAAQGELYSYQINRCWVGLVYLSEVCRMTFNAVDSDVETPLFYVVRHAHKEAFNFLIKRERVDIHHLNAKGENVLHEAARQGNINVVWSLVSRGGVGMVHTISKQGYSPLDLAAKQTTPKHQNTANLLRYLLSIKDRKYTPKGPLLAWYWHMVMPILMYGILIPISQAVPIQGFPMAMGVGLLLVLLLRHNHRIEHASGWPNPIFAGTFAAGLFHTFLFYFVVIFPKLYPEHLFFIVLSIMLTPIIIGMYLRLLLKDPGVVKESMLKEGAMGYFTVQDIALGHIKVEQYCPNCEIIPPPATKHCKLCEKCHVDMDHHCLFLMKCIARNNHRLFVIFIIFLLLCMLLFLGSCVQYLNLVFPAGDWYTPEKNVILFYEHAWLLSIALANLVSVVWGVCLVRFQLILVSKGYTTVFRSPYVKCVLTRRQRLMNILYFFIGRGIYAREPWQIQVLTQAMAIKTQVHANMEDKDLGIETI